MDWDLGLRGLAVLLAMSVGFGVVAHLLAWKVLSRWVGLVAGMLFFVTGLFISEVLFGWATEEDLQPNIDGLSFDEVLLGLIPAIAILLFAKHRATRRPHPGRGDPPLPTVHRRTPQLS